MLKYAARDMLGRNDSLTKTMAMLPDEKRKISEKINESCTKTRSEIHGYTDTDTRWCGQKNGPKETTS